LLINGGLQKVDMFSLVKKLAVTVGLLVAMTSIAAGSASARTEAIELRRDRAVAAYGSEGGQAVQGTGVGSTLRVTVLDQTDAALIIAQVTISMGGASSGRCRSMIGASRYSRT
jgi:hypothetical protein